MTPDKWIVISVVAAILLTSSDVQACPGRKDRYKGKCLYPAQIIKLKILEKSKLSAGQQPGVLVVTGLPKGALVGIFGPADASARPTEQAAVTPAKAHCDTLSTREEK